MAFGRRIMVVSEGSIALTMSRHFLNNVTGRSSVLLICVVAILEEER